MSAAEKLGDLLVVDDEPEVLKSIRRRFRRRFRVHTAESAEAGHRILAETPIQVILCDQRMPEETGVEFLRHTRDQYPDIIRMLITGYTDIQSLIAAVNEARIHRYITKPWNPEELSEVLESAFQRYREKSTDLENPNPSCFDPEPVGTAKVQSPGKVHEFPLSGKNRSESPAAEPRDDREHEKPAETTGTDGDIVLILDANRRIVRFNPPAPSLFNIPAEALLLTRCREIFGCDENKCNTCPIGPTEASDPFELSINRRGKTQFFRVEGFTLHGDTNLPDRYGLICKNVGDFKQMEETVRQGRKMEALGTLAGGITHDFNNILSVVLGYAQLVLDDLTPGTLPYNNQLEIIQAANRAAELIRHILTFCRKGAQDRKQFHPVPLVKETLKLLRAAIPATVEIRSRLAPDIPLIDADPIQIQQVLVNLCTNASFSMRNAGGTLSVEIDRASVSGPVCEQPDRPESSLPSGPCFRLRIRDTGEGIPDDLLDRIFDPYFTTKSKDEGTGLGLSVVQGIVRQHGGFVAVESELGVGSVFSVYLPEVKKAAAPEKTAVNKIFSGGTESILFVDDEPAILNMAAQTLEKLGYTVTTAKNGFEALTIFRENPKRFDLVVSDITMPKMPGDRLAGEILKIRPDMPLLLATGYSDRIKDASGLATGIRGILEKPLSKRELADTIRRALDGKPAGGRETAWPDLEIPSR